MPFAGSAFTLLLCPHLTFREIPTSSFDHLRPHTTITRRCLVSATLASHEHNSRRQKLSFYPTLLSAREHQRDSHKMLLILARNAEQVQLQQLPSFMLAFSMTAADNKRLNLRKFGRKDEHAICQISFYPTLVSSPHVQRDSHIKFGSSSPPHTTITRRCLAAAALASHEHNPRWQMLLSDSSIRTEKDSHKMLCSFNMAARRSGCCSQSTAWLQACIEYGCCRQQASQPAQVRTQELTCQLPAQLLPYSCVLTSRSERFPHQVWIIFAPHTTITRRCLVAAALASHEHNSRWQMLLSYSSIRTETDSTKCCAGSTWQLPGAVAAVNQLPGFKLALSMAAADNKRLTLRKFGRKDQHASCQLSFYPTLVSSPHVQRDSHIKF